MWLCAMVSLLKGEDQFAKNLGENNCFIEVCAIMVHKTIRIEKIFRSV